MCKIYEKYVRMVDLYSFKYWKEKDLIYFRKAVGHSGLRDTHLREKLLDHFFEKMPKEGYNLGAEHKTRAINYLKDKTFCRNGMLRKTSIFSFTEQHVLNNYSDFRLVDLYPQTDKYGDPIKYLAVYRCIAKDGTYFDYTGTSYLGIRVVNTNCARLKVV